MGRLKSDWTLARATSQIESISPGIIAATVPTGYDKTALDNYRRFQLSVFPAGHGGQFTPVV